VNELNATQRAILSAIGRTVSGGPPPTVRELAEQLHMKRSTVHYHLQALRRAGYISADEGRHRDMTLTGAARAVAARRGGASDTGASDDGLEIPILGRVAAGQPILAAEDRIGMLSLGSLFERKGPLFALVVKGDSMIEDGIHPGDYAIVRQQSSAVPGDTVVAMIEDGDSSEATIKRYREEGSAVVLEPANSRYVPLRFEGAAREGLRILGRLVGVLRQV
jgi:repressor LexA